MTILFGATEAESFGWVSDASLANVETGVNSWSYDSDFSRGSMKLKGDPVNAGADRARARAILKSQTRSEIWVHFALAMHTLPNAGAEDGAIYFTGVSNQRIGFVGSQGGDAVFRLRNAANNGYDTIGSINLVAQTLATYDVRLKINAADDLDYEFYKDGQLLYSGNQPQTRGATAWQEIEFNPMEQISDSNDSNIFVSEVIAADESTVDWRLFTINATGQGFYNEWNGTFQDINDNVVIDETDFVGASSENNTDLFSGRDLTAIGQTTTVIGVTVGIWADKDEAQGPQDIEIAIRTNNQDHVSPVMPNFGSTTTGYNFSWDINPETQQAWVPGEVNALQYGCKSLAEAGPTPPSGPDDTFDLGESLTGSVITMPNINLPDEYKRSGIADQTRFNLRGKYNHCSGRTSPVSNEQQSIRLLTTSFDHEYSLVGGISVLRDPYFQTWSQGKNPQRINVRTEGGRQIIDGHRFVNCHDTKIRNEGGDPSREWTHFINCWWTWNRDDVIDNEARRSTVVEDCLIDGGYHIYSDRNGSSELSDYREVSFIDCVIWCRMLPTPQNGHSSIGNGPRYWGLSGAEGAWGAGKFFKSRSTGLTIRTKNTIWCMDYYGAGSGTSESSWASNSVGNFGFPENYTGRLEDDGGNVIVWMGPGDYPSTNIGNIPVVKDWTVYSDARNAWITNHPKLARLGPPGDPETAWADGMFTGDWPPLESLPPNVGSSSKRPPSSGYDFSGQ